MVGVTSSLAPKIREPAANAGHSRVALTSTNRSRFLEVRLVLEDLSVPREMEEVFCAEANIRLSL